MAKTIDFYFDFGSPTAYLAYKRLQQLQAQYSCTIDYKPVLLGGLFKATGNASPVSIPAKGHYMMAHDLPRFAALYQVPLKINPHFPINTLTLMRAATAALGQDYFNAYTDAIYDAVWVNGENMGELDVIGKVLSDAGLDAEAILTGTQDPDVKAALISNTEAAITRGCFGAPTLFIGDDMFFGQDRMQFIEMSLQ